MPELAVNEGGVFMAVFWTCRTKICITDFRLIVQRIRESECILWEYYKIGMCMNPDSCDCVSESEG